MSDLTTRIEDLIWESATSWADESGSVAISDVPELARVIANEISFEPPRTDGAPRMTIAQRNRLWALCGRYGVPFREDDYVLQNRPTGLMTAGWVEGWVGGLVGKTIYVGVSPEGDSHS